MDKLPGDIWRLIFSCFGYDRKPLVCLLFVSKGMRKMTIQYCKDTLSYSCNALHLYQRAFWWNDLEDNELRGNVWNWWINSGNFLALEYHKLSSTSNRNFRGAYKKFIKRVGLWESFAKVLSLEAAKNGDLRFYRVSKSCFGCSFGTLGKLCFEKYAYYLYNTDSREQLKFFLGKQEGKCLQKYYFIYY